MPNLAPAGVRFQPSSDQSLLIYFGGAEPPRARKRTTVLSSAAKAASVRSAHENIRKLLHLLQNDPIAAVRNVHPGYSSLLVKFDALSMSHAALEKILRGYLQRLKKIELPPPREIEIPVCYGGEFGPDLSEVAAMHKISAERVIELHTSRSYLVYFLGFVPGFAYLGDLDEKLHSPRLPAPRRSVPAGSVGIAGNQTGVYPFTTPGGWRLLGRTPLEMFQLDHRELSLLAIGDFVRFKPISPKKFAELRNK
jgi:inhibitor of KinA